MTLYDWGFTENYNKYHQDTPPKVDLTKITMPTAMFVGSVDELGDPQDCTWAKNKISSMVHFEIFSAGHLTFMVGKDMSYFDTVK